MSLGIPGQVTVIDFETTSLDSPWATEIGLLALDDDLEPVAHFESLISPGAEPQQISLAHARLTRDMLVGAPTFKDIWPSIQPFLDRRVLVAHNARFDIDVLNREVAAMGIAPTQWSWLDSIGLTRERYSTLGKYNLEGLADTLNLPSYQAHAALQDCRAVGHLLRHLDERLPLRSSIASAASQAPAVPVADWAPVAPKTRVPFEGAFPAKSARDWAKWSLADPRWDISITGAPDPSKTAFGALFEPFGLTFNDIAPAKTKTVFLIVAEYGAGNSKLETARKYGIPAFAEVEAIAILQELQFLADRANRG